MQKLFNRLNKDYTVKNMKNCIKIELPIVLHTSGTMLVLKIIPNDSGYTIYCPTNIFSEANAGGDQTYYYNLFEKHDPHYHYGVSIKNGKISKDYTSDHNISVAINEFVRLYILLDDFIINNSVIGNEEKFE